MSQDKKRLPPVALTVADKKARMAAAWEARDELQFIVNAAHQHEVKVSRNLLLAALAAIEMASPGPGDPAHGSVYVVYDADDQDGIPRKAFPFDPRTTGWDGFYFDCKAHRLAVFDFKRWLLVPA